MIVPCTISIGGGIKLLGIGGRKVKKAGKGPARKTPGEIRIQVTCTAEHRITFMIGCVCCAHVSIWSRMHLHVGWGVCVFLSHISLCAIVDSTDAILRFVCCCCYA